MKNQSRKCLAAACSLVALLVVLALPGTICAEEAADAPKPVLSSSAYPLDVCAVSGGKLGGMGDPIYLTVAGRDVALCCMGCEGKIKESPEKYFSTVDAKIIEQQKDTYPLTTCLVSGNALPAVADRVYFVDNLNRLFAFCCEGCKGKVAAAPKEWGGKLDQAIAEARREAYPLTTCIVSAEPIDIIGDPVEAVIGGELFQFCCRGCANDVAARPDHYRTLLAKARAGEEIEQQLTPEEIHADDPHHDEEAEHAE